MRIGITGHQTLEDSTAWPWVASIIRRELAKLPPPFVAVSSLAVGADQLFAQIVLELGGTVIGIIPYVDIERSFYSDEDRERYRAIARNSTLHILHTGGTDQDAYLAAGLRVVAESDMLMAVWNGQAAQGEGGTADIVQHALNTGVPILHIEPIGRTVHFLVDAVSSTLLPD